MKCNLCDGDRFSLLFEGNIAHDTVDRFSQYAHYGDIYRCDSCGLVAQKLDHSVEEILENLKNEKYLDEKIGELNLAEKQHHFDMLIRYIREHRQLDGARVLDVGANTGVFLKRVKPLAGEIHGIEPSQEATQLAERECGAVVQNTAVADADLQDGSFDVITMWDVVEHLYDPKSDLDFLYSKLKPGGVLFITTHDVEELFARLTGRHYPMLMYQHFYHFSKRTLSAMLENAGYRVVGVQYHYKSWSLAYLHELLSKLWPENFAARSLGLLLTPFARLPGLRSLRITVPIRNFFIIAAEKPAADTSIKPESAKSQAVSG